MWRLFRLAVTHRLLAEAECCKSSAQQRQWSMKVKMTKNLQKMFDRQEGRKKKTVYAIGMSNPLDKDSDLTPKKKRTYSEGMKRRAHQVGRVLYDNIVQLVNSGELSAEIASYAVEIVKVKVVPDFSAVNVYWLASGAKEDEKLETLLKQHEGQLRHLLTSLYILGRIPRISFVRDNSRARYMKVESLLSKADFGPDFIPTRLDTSIRENIVLEEDSVPEKTLEDKLQEEFRNLALNNSGNNMDSAAVGLQDVKASSLECGPEDSSHGMSFTERVHPEKVPTSSHTFVPSSLEVEQLGTQLFGGTQTHPTNQQGATHVENTSPLLFDGFRDDIYGVPHTELMKKILGRKHKVKTKPQLSDMKHTFGNAPSAVSANTLKTVLSKKARGKSSELKTSDYHIASMLDLHGSQEEESEEIDENYEEDLPSEDDDHVER